MRILIILLLGGVLRATPVLELDAPFEPNSIGDDTAMAESLGVEWGLESPIPSSVDPFLFEEFEPLEQAFLANLPPGVGLESFLVAAQGGQGTAVAGLSAHLPVPGAGELLIIGGGLYLLLLLAGVVVERLRFRMTRSTKRRIGPAVQRPATDAFESELSLRGPAFRRDTSGSYLVRSRLE